MAAATYFDQVQQLYIAYFGRPADTVGLAYWAGIIDAANGNIAAVQAGFSASTESQALFGNKSTIDKVTAIYQNVFNRAPEPTGLAFWVAQLDSGKVTQAQASWTIQQNAGAGDAATVQNKLTAAKAFTAQIDTTAEITGYQGSNAADSARAFLKTVTSDNATATAAVTGAAAALAAAVGVGGSVGSTFTLTTSADNIVGTGGNDTIGGSNDATATQFSAVDSIDGGGGIDTLKLQLNGNYVGGATIKNIEKIQLTATAGVNFEAAGITGLTDLISIGAGGATDFKNVGSLANFTVQSNGAFAQTITYTEAAVAGTADAVSLTLNAAQNTVNVNSATANAAGVETINVVATGADSNVTLASNDTSVSKLTIAGDKALTLNVGTNVSTTATTIDASNLTGKLTLTGLGAADHTITGGSGDDFVNFGANFTAADKFDGKGGNDTLAANGAQLAAITTTNANITNVETLALADDVGATATTINAALFGTINNFRVADQQNADVAAVTVNGLAAATTGSNNIRFDGTFGAAGGTYTFNIAKATDPGTVNAVTLDLRGGATTASSIVTQGVETVTVDTTNATGLQTFNLTDASLTNLVVKGVQGVTLSGAALGGNVSSVDASGLTGAGLSITLNGTAATGANVTGSSLGDVVTGSNLRDIVNLGAGNDTFKSSGGLDTVTLGAGSDIVSIQSKATAVGAANVISITDFVAGTDKINLLQGTASATLAGVTIGVATTAAALSATLSNTTAVNSLSDVYTQLGTQLATLTASTGAAAGIVAQVVNFTNGSAAGTYLVVNDNTAGFAAADDLVINITGLSGTVSAADFTFTA